MFGVLGALTIDSGNGARVISGTRKPRTVLALLLMNRGKTVTITQMIGELWSSWPPDSAVANLRSYVSTLRTALGGERSRLMTRTGGYLLHFERNETDAGQFTDVAAHGRQALHEGDARLAVQLLRRALALWRGGAFEDVPLSPSLRMYARGLEEQRLAALDDLMRARLLLGEHVPVAAEARRMLAADPTHEPAWQLLIAALYQGGDPAGALRGYQEARQALVAHLGLEPGPQLRQLQSDILQQRSVAPAWSHT